MDETNARGATWVVLVAAGAGTRLGYDQPKAFAPLGGRPLLAESLERLELSDWIDAIVVVAPEGWEEPAILLAEELVVAKVAAVVTGGETRADSVAAGLAEVPDEALVVLVHDAARPLVTDAVVERVIRGLGDGAAGAVPGVPISDTIKRVDRDRVVETVERDALVAVQTPQAFDAQRLRLAYADRVPGATDCATLVEAAGGHVAVVAGDPRLLKVTDADDLARIEAWLAEP